MSTARKVKMGVFTLAMLNVAAIASLRGLPAMAEYGLSSIFFYVLAAVVFLIPTSLVSAELATGWPQKGGVYLWVKEAYNPRLGFLAIWLQWIQNVIWFPTVLSFAAGAVAYLINPDLAKNGAFTVVVILVVYWGATLLSFRGMGIAGLLGSWGVILGTLLPGAVIVILAVVFLADGNPPAMSGTGTRLIPNFSNFGSIVLAIGTFLYFAGMEMNAVHATEVDNPRSNYPKAIFIAVVIILAIFILGTLAIALVVPQKDISLTAGIMQAYTKFFDQFQMTWAVPVMGVLLAFGAFGGVITWVAGPSRGLLEVGQNGYLPPFFQKTNKHDVQVHILLVQGAIVTLLALCFLFMPNVSSSYWILSAMTVQLYLIMYILMFAAALRLRATQPDVERAYKVPAIGLVGGVGLLAAALAILIGFDPPSQFGTGSPVAYVGILVAGIVILSGAPLLIYQLRKPGWVQEHPQEATGETDKG